MRMKLFVALVILSILDCCASTHNPFFCYQTDPIRSMTSRASIYTGYEAIRRFNFTTVVNPYTPTGPPSRLWYFGRETARMPSAYSLRNMIEFAQSSVQIDIIRNYEEGRTTLCRPDFEAIRDFTKETEFGSEFEFTVENALLVMESGKITMENIAKRFQQRYPNILPNEYSRNHFYFRPNNTTRSEVALIAFATGLFGEDGAENVIFEPVPEIDWLLVPYEFCPPFQEETRNFAASQNAFRQGPEIEEMIRQVNRKLGFQTSNSLNFNQIYTMWNWCRFKIAVTFEVSDSEIGGNSTWCAPFSVHHHLLFEYYDDLALFYRTSFGVRNQRMLENLSCGPMQDLLTHMQSNSSTDPMARFFSTFSWEIQFMLQLLGAFRDVWPLTQHNFAQQINRLWNLSLMTPYSANLVVVRYDSADGDHDLIFLLNENPMLVPGCDQQTGVCKLSVIVNRFERFIDANCEVSFCSND